MKRVLMIVMALSLFVSVAFASDGLGFTVGVGYIEPNTDVEKDEESEISFEYEGVFMDGKLELIAELEYLHPLDSDKDGAMNIEIEGTYNINDNMAGILKLEVEMPLGKDEDVTIWLTPGYRHKFELGFGALYTQADFPLYLGTSDEFSAMDFVNFDLTFSLFRLREYGGEHGFGAELFLHNYLSNPDDDADFLQGLTLTPYFENELLYAELEIGMPLWKDGMKSQGLHIIPEVEVNIPQVSGLSVWLNVPISNIGVDEKMATEGKDAIIGFGAGLNFRF